MAASNSSSAASNSSAPAPTSTNPLPYNIGPSLSFGPVRGDSRAKQLFNAVYFGATGVAIAATINYLHMHLFWPIVSFLVLAGLMALRFTINNRAHPKDFEVSFSTASRRFIRAAALLLPIPILVFAMARIPANWEYDEGLKLYDSANYAAAVPHFETALRFNPQYSEAQEMLTYSYFFSDDFQKALASANVALLAYPDNSSLLAEKAYVLNLNEKYQEAIPLAQKAAQLDPTNGQAFSCLAESNYRLGHFLPALEAANRHVKLHYDEPEALRSRESILSSLGRDSEAALDAAAAAKLDADQAASDTTSSSTDNSGTTVDTN
jgi:tetratricopeptide (TPR) repeat protein